MEGGLLVRDEVEHTVACHDVHAGVRKGNLGRVPFRDRYVGQTHPLDVRSRLLNHRGREIQANDPASGPGKERRVEDIRTRSRADVEDRVPGSDRLRSERIADAGEGFDRRLRKFLQVLIRVPDEPEGFEAEREVVCLAGLSGDLRVQILNRGRDDGRKVRHDFDPRFGRHMRNLHDFQRKLVQRKLPGRPERRARPFKSVQDAGLLQTNEASIRVVFADPEHLRDLVDRSEVSVLLQVLQDVGGGPLREARPESVDHFLERPRREDLALRLGLPSGRHDEREEVRSRPLHHPAVLLEGRFDLRGVEISRKPSPIESDRPPKPKQGLLGSRCGLDLEGLHHPTKELLRLVLILNLRGLEGEAGGIGAPDPALPEVSRIERILEQGHRLPDPLNRGGFVDGILFHPRVEILTHPADAVFDLEAISVNLPQPLEDRFQPPAPPTPRIGEMDDLHVGRGLSWHQETSQRTISAGNLEADRCPPRRIILEG